MAVELMHGLESNLRVSLPMVSFLEGLSISQIAAQVLAEMKAHGSTATTGLAPIQKNLSKVPLTYGQRALWFLHQLAPESAAYNIVFAARLQGELDVPILYRAFQALADRHPSLRTTFAAPQGEPFQRIYQQAQVCFDVKDASDLSESSLNDCLIEQGHVPFDLEHGPLLQISIFTKSSQEHVLLLAVHHIIADLWSLAVMMREIGKLYSAERNGNRAALPTIALQYAGYAGWQSETPTGAEGDRLWAYWRDQLAGQLPVLNLPTDRPRPSVQTYLGASHPFKLDADLNRKLQALGKAQGTTLYMTLLATFHVLLYRFTGQEDILVGSPTACRKSVDVAGLVGYFVNPVVMRGQPSSKMTFMNFLNQVRRMVLAAFEHQEFPFALLVERLQPKRELNRSPLFQAMFILQKSHLLDDNGLASFALGEAGARMHLGDLQLESMALIQRVAQFDLTLMAAEVEAGLATSWQYNSDLFDDETIARMAGCFQTLLEEIVSNPEQRIGDLSLLGEHERRNLLVEWNNTRAQSSDPREEEDVCTVTIRTNT
jgi:hypothetical protein